MLQSLFCAVLLLTVVTSVVGKYLLLVVINCISYNSCSRNKTLWCVLYKLLCREKLLC